jgi:hypothetical protein
MKNVDRVFLGDPARLEARRSAPIAKETAAAVTAVAIKEIDEVEKKSGRLQLKGILGRGAFRRVCAENDTRFGVFPKTEPSERPVHALTIWKRDFEAVLSGAKMFDVRKADRDLAPFRVGDIIHYSEADYVDGKLELSGRSVCVLITFIQKGTERNAAISTGYVAMSVRLYEF